ncbi:MAG: hypothetical protein Q8922_03655 [Bacteroidota bacterium]|nr:hypothetical protein [Bacteroidota bacterium]MDP4233388.1 hypothetical protein [Bacteroidota bacterium]MDP4242254.1 hypothetical protein [Bacteroidota bacterium]MDP4287010.1 hypothetical protein [Bacteroidota bacterium]
MKKSLLVSLLALTACAPSTATVQSTDYLNSNAQHSANVSTLYALASIGTGTGIEFKWLDSTGISHKLSEYQGSKPVVLVFGKTSDSYSTAQYASLDSVRSEMGDSVGTIAFADDNAPTNFNTVTSYVSAHHFLSQFITDSTQRVEIQFATAGLSGPTYYVTESLVLGKDGKLVTNGFTAGPAYKDTLEARVRQAYK